MVEVFNTRLTPASLILLLCRDEGGTETSGLRRGYLAALGALSGIVTGLLVETVEVCVTAAVIMTVVILLIAAVDLPGSLILPCTFQIDIHLVSNRAQGAFPLRVSLLLLARGAFDPS